jgi:hypothetical protein
LATNQAENESDEGKRQTRSLGNPLLLLRPKARKVAERILAYQMENQETEVEIAS